VSVGIILPLLPLVLPLTGIRKPFAPVEE